MEPHQGMHAFLSARTQENLLKIAAAAAVVLFGGIFFVGTGITWYGFGISEGSTTSWIMTFTVIGAFALIWVGPRLEKIPRRAFWAGLIGFFLISKVAWLILIPTQPTSDFANYDAAARAVAHGLGINPVTNNGLNGWGYPFFLGTLYKVFGASINVGKIANLVLDLAALWLLYRIALLAFGRLTARWSVVVFTVWPIQIAYTSVLGTEHLSIALGLAGVLCAVMALKGQNPYRNMLVCGLSLGVGYLTRPAVLAFAAAAALAVFFMQIPFKRRLALLALVGVAFGCVNGLYSLGLQAFNRGNFPDPQWSIGANLVFGSNYQSGGAWNAEDQKLLGSWPKEQLLANALQLVQQRFSTYSPLQILDLAARKANYYWNAVYYGVHWSANFRFGPDPVISPKFQPLYNAQFYFQGLVIFLGMLGGAIAFRKPNPILGLILFSLLFATLIHVLTVSDSRYQYSFEPLLMVLAALALSVRSKPAAAESAVSG
jgi:hypothetical protein